MSKQYKYEGGEEWTCPLCNHLHDVEDPAHAKKLVDIGLKFDRMQIEADRVPALQSTAHTAERNLTVLVERYRWRFYSQEQPKLAGIKYLVETTEGQIEVKQWFPATNPNNWERVYRWTNFPGM